MLHANDAGIKHYHQLHTSMLICIAPLLPPPTHLLNMPFISPGKLSFTFTVIHLQRSFQC
jgi:hypothetical protein